MSDSAKKGSLTKLDLYHFDYAGEPYCGAESEGAFVVEIDAVTCPACLESIQKASTVMDYNLRRYH